MQKNYHYKKYYLKDVTGFALIEMIVVIGILTIIFAFGLAVNFDFYKGYIFHSEQSILVSTLEKARSRSINNLFETSHGVCYISPNYIIFRGTSCVAGTSTNETVLANANIASKSSFSTSFGPSSPIIFSQLAATTTDTSIVMTDGIRTVTTTINNEGRINW